jgi:uncharacterized membrane-anchored protein
MFAKQLRTEGDSQNGLNYNIRVLGREGVLVLNAVAGIDQLAKVKTWYGCWRQANGESR